LRRHVTPLRVVGAVVVLAVVTGLILLRIPSGQYLLLPDVAHPVAPLVKVENARPAKDGALYFVDVREQEASELDRLFPWLHEHATLEPAGAIVPPCSTAAQAEAAQFEAMRVSQQTAAAVALRRLGYHVAVRPVGVVVSQLFEGTNAPCKLQPMDVIVSLNGKRTPTVASLHRALTSVKPDSVVDLRVRRGSALLPLSVRTVSESAEPGRAFIGIGVGQAARIKLPVHVSIDASGIGGPSAGLAFTLEVMQQLGRNVLHGHRVAATGEMELDGSVGPIGGVKQKTYGVREAGADVFLVPAGENAKEARRYAGPVRIVPVRTLNQALRALATLPRAQ
jgi:PDZ domain-containing protein